MIALIINILLQTAIDFKAFENLGMIGLLVAVIYFLYKFLITQNSELKTELKAEINKLRAENEKLRDLVIKLQSELVELIGNNQAKKGK
jgi:cell division protein FtsB